MAVADTYAFNLQASQVFDAAFAMIGGQETTAYELKQAQIRLQLMLKQLQNEGVNMWAVDRQYLTLVEGVGIYTLDSATVDVVNTAYGRYWNTGSGARLTAEVSSGFTTTSGSTTVTITDASNGAQAGDPINITNASAVGGITLDGDYVITEITGASTYTVEASSAASSSATGGGTATITYYTTTDLPVTRIPLDQFSAYPQKGQTGPARQFYLNRSLSAPTLYILPVPDGSQQQFIYWRKRKLADIPNLSYNLDIPDRFLSPIVSGLAYWMSFLRPQVPGIAQTRAELQQAWRTELQQALDEDREPAPTMMMPDLSMSFR